MQGVRPSAWLVLTMLGISALLGGGAPVLCLHRDGTAELESGADPCCRGADRGHPSSSPVAAISEAPGGCPGCEDRVLSLDARSESHRSPIAYGIDPAPMAPTPDPERVQRIERPETAHVARGAPSPRPLRI